MQPIIRVSLTTLLVLVLLYFMFSAFQDREVVHSNTISSYATWQGTGPDKWASIWLVSRIIDPGTTVKVFSEGSKDPDYTFFDIPNVPLNRDANHSSFAKLIDTFKINSTEAKLLERVIHDIDIRLWRGYQEQLSSVVEAGFRQLQASAGRDAVHPDCYMAFFDHVAAMANLSIEERQRITIEQLLPSVECQHQRLDAVLSSKAVVPELPLDDLLTAIAAGTQVSFVDVREIDEYKEGHIPGAINITLRDLDESQLAPLRSADLIVTYCVKDFRGFEMAKKLQQQGFDNVVLLNPYGLKGWLQAGLPMSYGEIPITETAQLAFNQCVQRSNDCPMTL